LRRKYGSGGARTGGASMAFVASLAAVAAAVAVSAAGTYVLLAMLTSVAVVPTSAADLRVLASLSLAIGGFAVLMATRDELRARRRGKTDVPAGVSGGSRRLAASGSRARPEPSR
jgi:hypothetical protein